MKRKFLVIGLMFAGSITFAQTKIIHFETGSFADMKAKAKKENKLLFIDGFTSWCGPCKMMAKVIFTNDTVADYFNAKFINAQFDMEKGEGIEIRKLYEVNCFPNLLFIDGDGKLLHRGAGASDAKNFIQLAEDALNPDKRFSKFQNDYISKKNDPAFLVKYIDVLSGTCLKFDNVLEDYFKTQKDEALTNRANWNMIRDYSSNYKSREVVYLLSNSDAFNKLYTPDSVKSKVLDIFMNGGYSIIYKKDMKDADYAAYIAEIKKIKLSAIDEVLFRLEMAFSEKKEDWKKHVALIVANGDNYFHTPNEYNQVSWTIYEHSEDKAAFQKAELWMQKAVKAEPNFALYDTYACVLYKLGKKSEAKLAATKAIDLAKADGAPEEEYKATTELLQKIEKLN